MEKYEFSQEIFFPPQGMCASLKVSPRARNIRRKVSLLSHLRTYTIFSDWQLAVLKKGSVSELRIDIWSSCLLNQTDGGHWCEATQSTLLKQLKHVLLNNFWGAYHNGLKSMHRNYSPPQFGIYFNFYCVFTFYAMSLQANKGAVHMRVKHKKIWW